MSASARLKESSAAAAQSVRPTKKPHPSHNDQLPKNSGLIYRTLGIDLPRNSLDLMVACKTTRGNGGVKKNVRY